jgi:hypothetical protein
MLVRVTSAKIDPTIKRLIDFLNFNFERYSEKRLKDARLNSCELRAPDWRIAGKRLQKEIRDDLIPLISGRDIGLDCLDSILDKASQLNLHFRWYAESTQYQESMRSLRPERRVLKLAGQKFIVRRQLTTFESFRELFYGVIAESLENGSFSRLKICPECHRTFVPEDPKRRFCENKKCKDSFHNRERLERGYFRKTRKLRRDKQLKAARGLRLQGKGFSIIQEKTGLSRRILEREGLV